MIYFQHASKNWKHKRTPSNADIKNKISAKLIKSKYLIHTHFVIYYYIVVENQFSESVFDIANWFYCHINRQREIMM